MKKLDEEIDHPDPIRRSILKKAYVAPTLIILGQMLPVYVEGGSCIPNPGGQCPPNNPCDNPNPPAWCGF